MDILRNKKILLNIIFGLCLYFAAIAVFRQFDLSPANVQFYAKSFGFLGYISLFLVQIVTSLTPLPDSPISILGIVLYGPFLGGLIIYLGMFFAAVLHYYFARKLGKNIILKHIPELEPYMNVSNKWRTFVKLVIMRNVALISFDVSAYVAGMTGVGFGLFTISTLVGLIPVIIGNIILAQGIYTQTWGQSFLLLLVYIIFIALIFTGRKLLKKFE